MIREHCTACGATKDGQGTLTLFKYESKKTCTCCGAVKPDGVDGYERLCDVCEKPFSKPYLMEPEIEVQLSLGEIGHETFKIHSACGARLQEIVNKRLATAVAKEPRYEPANSQNTPEHMREYRTEGWWKRFYGWLIK